MLGAGLHALQALALGAASDGLPGIGKHSGHAGQPQDREGCAAPKECGPQLASRRKALSALASMNQISSSETTSMPVTFWRPVSTQSMSSPESRS